MSVTADGRKSSSLKMNLSKGDMPLTRKPDRMFAGVMALGNAVPTTPAMS